MPNVAFDLEVFKKVAATSQVPGDAKFAQLGAIGPDLFKYLPISSKLSDALHDAFAKGIENHVASDTLTFDLSAIRNDSALAIEFFEKPLMAAYSLLFREVIVEFWPLLQRDADTLAALQVAADHQDPNAVASLKDALQQVSEDGARLKQLAITLKGVQGILFQIIVIPPGIQSTNPQARPWLPFSNRLFEFLRWHRTNRFAGALQSLADADTKRAYAFGYLCHTAASVTGEPFINNIVGGPYRAHWWRNRLVSNFVDSWTFGRYETPATLSGDTPSIPYPSWRNIRTANLQDGFNVASLTAPADGIPDAVSAVASGQLGGLPAQFPQDLAAYIQAAIDSVYPAAARPPGFTTDAIQQAFTGLFAVVWFMTAGFGPSSWDPSDLGDAPSACPTAPSWVTDGGSPPSPQSGPSVGDILAGIVFAICALIDFIFGSWGDGVALLKNAIGHFGTQTDWDQFKCNTYWLRKLLLDAGLGLVDAMVQMALVYPAPSKLGTVDANGVTHPAVDLSANPMPLTKSNAGVGDVASAGPIYPHRMDTSVATLADLHFSAFPVSTEETAPTLNFPIADVYADTATDGSGLQNGGMLADVVFPSANQFFGDALSNATQLLGVNGQGLPSFNLDADRGYGWKTWTATVGTFPGSGQVDPVPEP